MNKEAKTYMRQASQIETDVKAAAIHALHHLRKEKGLTLSELSYLTESSVDTLDRIEVGRHGLSFYMICLLASIYGKSVRIVFE